MICHMSSVANPSLHAVWLLLLYFMTVLSQFGLKPLLALATDITAVVPYYFTAQLVQRSSFNIGLKASIRLPV